jgi:hypothetical protein
LVAADTVDGKRVITGRPVTVSKAFAAEHPRWLPPSAEPFRPARPLQAWIDHRAQVCVRQAVRT